MQAGNAVSFKAAVRVSSPGKAAIGGDARIVDSADPPMARPAPCHQAPP